MTDPVRVRTAAIGLVGFAAAEEQMLLAAEGADGAVRGSPAAWAARPLVAHNAECRDQQVQRLAAIRGGRIPPDFAEIDHSSPEAYRRYCERPAGAVADASKRTAQALVAGLSALADDDLLAPPRHPRPHCRQLWLQVIVWGFWHPTGHLGDYYLARGWPGRAVALQAQAVSLAACLDAPDLARGMACYNLACAQARSGRPGDAFDALSEAVVRNASLLANAVRDSDLRSLRDGGRLDALL